jgi:hypothetical protein
MLNSCPNKSSQEWKDLLEETNGNEDRALELWTERYNEEGLNEEPETEPEAEPEEKPEDDFSKLIKRIKTFAEKKLAMLQKKKLVNQTEKEVEYKRLVDTIKAAEGVESINIFVRDAYLKATKAKTVMTNLLAKKGSLSKKEVLNQLTAIAEFASGYSILDEIAKEDIYKYFMEDVDPSIPDDKLTPQQMLSKARNIRDTIKQKYLKEGIPLMADFLLQYKVDVSEKSNAEIENLRKRIDSIEADTKVSDKFKAKRIAELEERITILQNFSLDKRGMINLLKEASTDTSVLDYLISPLISSEDAALSLFAKAIKSQMESARMMDIKMRDELADQFEEFAKTVSASRDNVAKFNEGLYEELISYYKDPKTGKIKESKKMAFVQKYDLTAYNKAKSEFLEALGEPPILSDPATVFELERLKSYNRKKALWYSKNKQLKPQEEINAIFAAKRKERDEKIITQEEYEEWLGNAQIPDRYSPDGVKYNGQQFYMPAQKYLNPKWTAMYNMDGTPKNAKGKYHKYLLDTYLKAQDKLPDGQKRGYLLPSIPKTDRERIQANGIGNFVKTNIKEMGQIQAYDVGIQLATASGEESKFIPTYYTQNMSADDVSLDLGRSVLMFNAMANRYDAINQVNGEITLFKTIIGEREAPETTSKGTPILDAFAKKLGYEEFIRQNGESFSKKHVNAFIDMVIYGEMQKAEEVLGLSLGKITNTLSAFSALTSIAIDGLKGIANNLQGNIQMIIESNSGEFFTKKNLASGKKYYLQAVPGMLGDFGKSKPKSLLNRLVERYDALQGNFKDQYGKNVTSSAAMRLMRTDTLFFNQHLGEHEIQVSCMLALMDATMVKDKNGEEISLFEAHQRYGDAGVEENTDFTEKKRQDFQNRLHALNKRMHGVYNDFDKGTSQRYSLGRLVVMYRKHLVPGYKRRWKRLSMDEELGAWTEGFYRTFWNTFVRDLRDYKFNIMQNWSTYSPFEKAQIKRVIAEATIVLTTTALVYILKKMVDDDDDELKKSWVYNFVLYEMIRMRSETSSYISPTDAYRVVKSPSAMTSTLERAIKFGDQFFLTWDPEKLEYQRKQGIWNEGDNKSWAYFLKLMGYSGYNITPAEAVQSFEGTLKK